MVDTDLSRLHPGEKAKILNIDAEEFKKRRMMDIGIIPGTYVEMIKTAPFGDPVQISLRNADFIIRKEDAKDIKISKIK